MSVRVDPRTCGVVPQPRKTTHVPRIHVRWYKAQTKRDAAERGGDTR